MTLDNWQISIGVSRQWSVGSEDTVETDMLMRSVINLIVMCTSGTASQCLSVSWNIFIPFQHNLLTMLVHNYAARTSMRMGRASSGKPIVWAWIFKYSNISSWSWSTTESCICIKNINYAHSTAKWVKPMTGKYTKVFAGILWRANLPTYSCFLWILMFCTAQTLTLFHYNCECDLILCLQ